MAGHFSEALECGRQVGYSKPPNASRPATPLFTSAPGGSHCLKYCDRQATCMPELQASTLMHARPAYLEITWTVAKESRARRRCEKYNKIMFGMPACLHVARMHAYTDRTEQWSSRPGRLPVTQEIAGSSPACSASSKTKRGNNVGLWGRSSDGRAPRLHCGCREFDSLRFHHDNKHATGSAARPTAPTRQHEVWAGHDFRTPEAPASLHYLRVRRRASGRR